MNILIMADYTPQNSGNFIGSIHDLIEYCNKLNNDVFFAIPKRGNGVPWENMITDVGGEFIYIDPELSDNQKLQLMDDIIAKYQIDIIHIHFGLWVRLISSNKKRWKGIKVILHDHMDYSVESPVWKQMVRQWLYALVYRIYGVAVISVMKRKNDGYFFLGKKHWYIPNALSLKRNVPVSMDREHARAQMGINDDEKLCLLLGWDKKRKGIDIALKAIQECRTRNENVVFGVVGLSGDPSKENMEWIRDNTGVNPNVSWIRYIKSTEDMYAYHRASDVFLSASRKEAFSYGILEAISQNIPTVVSKIPGTMWAEKYSKCFLFDNEDVAGCSRAISEAVKVTYADSNYQDMIKEYDILKWCEKIFEIYESC